ncbi:hypothetical protein [Ralstonia pseudosolanacearum]|uniref:hypothetical protein n=1 Tax=Ralstonia pseudosolanacearum TaxID=1310165 RepID=UPI0006763061|nr:hypothetical protein [Ralstonia pseudosolanacearum]MDO3559442.1 hypothetical protein [Ralstonia pseudosolanacearum]MDO3579088.1 hypothetical protein [Ralstonia pseudosolanacearum]MDO3588745.1 hypothetical protein [Ralstonia pseudosolanacearum]
MTTEATAGTEDQTAAQGATTTTAAPTQTAATAAPAIPTQQTQAATSATTEGAFGPAVSYEKTGDANLDLALTFFGKQGIGMDHAAVTAAVGGDFGPLKAILAEKGVAGWEAHVALAERAYEAHQAKASERNAQTAQVCVAAAGGEAEWGQVLQWASTNADETEKPALNAALAQGGIVAEAVAHFLVGAFRQAPGTSYDAQKSAVNQHAGTAAGNAFTPLSPLEYGRAVAALRGKLGPNFESTQEYASLNQRRAMYRG